MKRHPGYDAPTRPGPCGLILRSGWPCVLGADHIRAGKGGCRDSEQQRRFEIERDQRDKEQRKKR